MEFFQEHGAWIGWVTFVSLASLPLYLLGVSWFVIRLPEDYFINSIRHPSHLAEQHPVIRLILIVGKNILGYLFIAMGVLLLVLPGQGLLTIMVGVLLIDFPGKFKLERYLIHFTVVQKSMNWLRKKSGHSPLYLP